MAFSPASYQIRELSNFPAIRKMSSAPSRPPAPQLPYGPIQEAMPYSERRANIQPDRAASLRSFVVVEVMKTDVLAIMHSRAVVSL